MLMLSLIAFISAGTASAAGTAAPVSVFPSSLLYIEDEAFEATAFRAVFLPDGFLGFGDRVFRDAAFLHAVFIPKTTTSIGTDPFPQNRSLVLHVVEESYACEWARQQNLSFAPDYELAQLLSCIHTQSARSNTALNTVQLFALEVGDRSKGQNKHADRSMRPQDRPELHPINYRFP